MRGPMVEAIERLVLVLWLGSAWTVGYLVAPTLFSELGEPLLAGHIAGRLFTWTAALGLVCAAVLLITTWRAGASGRERWRWWVVLSMAALVAIGEFGVRSLMVPGAPDFGRLHGVAQTLFLLVSLLGLLLVLAGVRPREHAR